MTTKKKVQEEIPLDTAYAMAKAAEALDETMRAAAVLNDTNTMLEVVNGWLTVAALLNPEESDEDEHPATAQSVIGFTHEHRND